ncbi:hypothetical protein AV929_18380 [Haloarcula sp. K1]|nr:hypothetical protein AV929_18380 [Haloarcula sp. K1]
MSDCIWAVCKPEQRAILFFCITYGTSVIGIHLTNWAWGDEKETNGFPWIDEWWILLLVAVILYVFGGFNSQLLFI